MPFVPLETRSEHDSSGRSGFVPLADAEPQGFLPLEPDKPSVLRNVLLENPLTAAGEAAMNFGSQLAAVPAAGLAGIGSMATHAMGFSDEEPADTVHRIGEFFTYQPRSEMGRQAAGIISYPFEKLAEAGQYVGDKTLAATGSPVAATVADTAVNALPMLIGPVAKKGGALLERGATRAAEHGTEGFFPLNNEAPNGSQVRTSGVEANDSAMYGPQRQRLEALRPEGDQGLSRVEEQLQSLPDGRWPEAGAEPVDLVGAPGHERGLSPGQRGLGSAPEADYPAQILSSDSVERGSGNNRGSGAFAGNAADDTTRAPVGNRSAAREGDQLASSAISEGFEVPDLQRQNTEHSRVGGGVGGEDRYIARAFEEGDATGAGIAARELDGKGFAPLKTSIDAAAHEAATSPLNELAQPTGAQIEAGTYKKGAVRLHGLDIAIENPKGSIRSGVSPEGNAWQTEMQHHYGYVRRTVGKDGDPVDVFIGQKPESTRVFVIDQIDPKTGRFDEHKAVLGAETESEAKAIYQANYEPGWKGAGAVTEVPVDTFRAWVKSADTKKPVAIPNLMGKRVTEYSDTELAKLARSRHLTTEAQAKAATELGRRSSVEDLRKPETQDMAAGVQNSWAPGQNYVPLMDQAAPAVSGAKSVTDLPAPIRRERIVKDFASSVGTTVYEGRVKGKNRLGFFRSGVDEVRTKRANDLEVAAHEVAHLIDSRVPELSRAWRNDKALREELKSISYDQQSVSEGFAEGVRLFLTQPETLEAKAPKVHAWLESFTAKNKTYGPTLRTAQDRMTAWYGQYALNRARSKIGTDKPMTEYFDRFWDKFRQSTVDDLHGVYAMERDMTGGIHPNGPYESARLSRASASIADGAVRFGYPVKQADGSFKFAGRGLEEILQPVAKSLDDALLYFVGRSSAELMGQGREHLFSKGEIDAMLRLRTPEREQAFNGYQAWNKGVLDFAEAQGVINPEARRLWQRTQYLPFHRVEQPGGLKGKPGDWSGIQQLTGGTTNIKDVLGNMIGNAAMLIDKAVKNEARVKIAKLAQQKGGGKFMVKIDTGAKPVKISGDQVIEAMLKKYGIAVDGDAPVFFQFMVHGQPPAGANVVAVLQHGKPVWFEVGDPILYRALKAIDRPIQSEVVRWLGLPKRIGQAAITATPDFWMANIARDTIMGSVMSRAGFRPVLDSLKGMTSRITKDPIYRDYLANGGGLSSYFLDEHHLRTKLEKFYRGQGIDYRTVLDAPDKLLSFIETLGDAFEMSTRLGEYKRAMERGENPRHAAYLGRDVSTDFAMKGDSKALGFMMDVTMFLRPALVSWDRLYRGLAHDPNKGAIAAKAGTIALMSAGLYLLNRDDARYQDLPDWDRDANWHFFIGDQHFRWPKIWEVGAVASLAERSTEKVLNDNPDGLGEDFARILGATFNLNYMPQLVAPLYEQATNRNPFTKAPIETPGMENVQPFLRVKPGTSETMKALGRATGDMPESMQVNPARAEALLRGYFNTWATYGLMLTDQALFGDQLPAKRTDELPVVRRFYSQEPAKHTRYESEFYDMLSSAKRLRGTLKELDDLGRSDWADRKEQSPLAGEAKPLERAAKNLGSINRDMEAVRRDTDLTPEQKRQKLDALTFERNALMKATVKDSKASQAAWKDEIQRAEAKLQRMRMGD